MLRVGEQREFDFTLPVRRNLPGKLFTLLRAVNADSIKANCFIRLYE
jgi:hypothetical protein